MGPSVPPSVLLGVIPGFQFGYSVAISGSNIVVGGPESQGSAFIYTTDLTLVTKLEDASITAGTKFGWSVAIDGSIVAVGAKFDSTKASLAGAVFVFDSAGTFLRQLVASDGVFLDVFGDSVAVSGSTIVVGAILHDSNGLSNNGAAYVFDATTGQQLHKLVPLDTTTDDQFGNSVGISGSIIVVGARIDRPNGADSGSAYIFDTSGAEVAKIVPADNGTGHLFGMSVAIDGSTIVVGAPGRPGGGGTLAGAVYVFNTAGAELMTLEAPDAVPGANLGYSVSISGSKIVAGAYKDPVNGIASGSAYVFDATTGTFVEKFAPSGQLDDYFGWSIGVSGSTVVVGAPKTDIPAGGDAGAAHVFGN